MALEAGRKPLADILEVASKKGGLVNGDDAFLLYDTYGFPLEITMDAAADRGLQVVFLRLDYQQISNKYMCFLPHIFPSSRCLIYDKTCLSDATAF